MVLDFGALMLSGGYFLFNDIGQFLSSSFLLLLEVYSLTISIYNLVDKAYKLCSQSDAV